MKDDAVNSGVAEAPTCGTLKAAGLRYLWGLEARPEAYWEQTAGATFAFGVGPIREEFSMQKALVTGTFLALSTLSVAHAQYTGSVSQGSYPPPSSQGTSTAQGYPGPYSSGGQVSGARISTFSRVQVFTCVVT